MAAGPEYPAAEHQQLVESLDMYPSISLVGFNGGPPEECEIAYNLHSYAPVENGTEVKCNHCIQIPFFLTILIYTGEKKHCPSFTWP
ncbi:MAG: hypothetical protein GX087_12260 [Desulfobulbaceae bacterium]|nr:hypothetical protein [Desulfobulbaceae bacterium]